MITNHARVHEQSIQRSSAEQTADRAVRASGTSSSRRRRQMLQVLQRPSLLWQVLNAQIHLRHATSTPISVRLQGRIRAGGGGRIVLGERVRITGATVPVELLAWRRGRIAIGEGTFINYGTSISAHDAVTIGRDCAIGQYVIINDNDYHDIVDKHRLPPSAPVVLEDRVWLGARVIVLKGVRIGHDTVVGAGSVVTSDIPPRSIAVGMPARVIRQF
jgi:acetyltransferase-like isoleucine patch superfamily enzyme